MLAVLLNACVMPNKNQSNTILTQRKSSIYDINYDQVTDDAIEKTIHIIPTTHSLDGVKLNRFMYSDEEENIYPAGLPLVVKYGNVMKLHVINKTSVDTNIHWHGLSLPNDQDGPHLLIPQNGGEFTYEFTPDYSGSYWYHSHFRPVRDQVDFGMHGPLIILNESDQQYTLDRILMLDDWIVRRIGGRMQVEGDIDTVNGLSYQDIEPLVITNHDLVKLRFIQSSTAKNTTLYFPFNVKVTHLDGIALNDPYETDIITLVPGERYDVEFQITQSEDELFLIRNERNRGMIIPIHYTYTNPQVTLDRIKPTVERIDDLVSKANDVPNIFVDMGQRTSHGRGHEWTINGEIFPDAEEFELDLNKEYIIRFKNLSRMFNHPMHIHGSHFKVLSINGRAVNTTIWKDTINVLPGQYVDVAIRFDRPGLWMLHCHILDHEDGGMMTTIIVKD